MKLDPRPLTYAERIGLILNIKYVRKLESFAVLDAVATIVSGSFDRSWFEIDAQDEEEADAKYNRWLMERQLAGGHNNGFSEDH